MQKYVKGQGSRPRSCRIWARMKTAVQNEILSLRTQAYGGYYLLVQTTRSSMTLS